MKIAWYSKKWVIILLHSVCWVALFSLPFILTSSNNQQQHSNQPRPHNDNFIYFYILTSLTWIAFFYLNAFFLISKLLYQKKYWQFALAQIFSLAAIILLHRILFYFIVEKKEFILSNALFNIFPFLFIIACSLTYRMVLSKIDSDKLIQQKENENLKTELSFLRSQVSPHFMFNVLNNMVALARKKSELLEPSLIKLSSLMRYMLYEADETKVSLDKEIEYLQSYIDLQQQRFGKNVCIRTSLNDTDNNYVIEPMLLIPFVENSFKHGTGLVEKAQIDIELKAKNNILNFVVRNRYNPGTEEEKDKTSGIGLANVERRLNLLYGKNHTLLINRKDGWFTISLQLNLH
jgi:two-component system LytT family sensor kinase